MNIHLNLRCNIALGLIIAFVANMLGPFPAVQAQELSLPAPGQMVALSPEYSPVVLKGIKLDPKNPFRFHFYVDRGDSDLSQQELKSESAKLIKYFLASLTIPEKDLWVNLSPYEKDRIVPPEFGQTQMGRDLLAEDYLLKQITASLIYPESRLGKEFWNKVYAKAQSKYGTTNIPINTFNKVWILPDKAVVYENNGVAFVLENHLKVMLEEDYLSLQKHTKKSKDSSATPQNDVNTLGSQIVREIVIPALTKEVNEGKNFAQLRQVFYSLILATWYKKKIKDSILNRVYSNHKKVENLSSPDALVGNPEHIYQQYLKAFKKGVYNYIKDDPNPATGETTPRKYFSGGVNAAQISVNMAMVGPGKADPVLMANAFRESYVDVTADASLINPQPSLVNRAQLASEMPETQFESEWQKYAEQNGLSQYPEVTALFTRLVKEELLDDRALRPVFLQVLPKEAVGEMIVSPQSKDLVRLKLKDGTLLDLMNQCSSFYIGNAKVAHELLQRPSMKIIIGVTDKYSDDTMYPLHQVANGRQAYFPLPDGRWLGVKGSGQYRLNDQPPFYKDKKLVGPQYFGLAGYSEAQWAFKGTSVFEGGQGNFVPILGYRRLYEAPDGNGNLLSVAKLKLKDGNFLNPVLIFNLVQDPRRLEKLPQLIKTDPGLQKLRRKISKILGMPKGSELSASELILMNMKNIGRNEASKQNKGWFKVTINNQDRVLSGQEADNEEFRPLEYYKQTIKERMSFSSVDSSDLLFKGGLSTAGLASTVIFLAKMMSPIIPPDQRKILLPSAFDALKELFQAYFSSLDDRYLKIWATEKNINGVIQSWPTAYWMMNLDRLDPEFGPNSNIADLDKKVRHAILSWAKQEVLRRHSAAMVGFTLHDRDVFTVPPGANFKEISFGVTGDDDSARMATAEPLFLWANSDLPEIKKNGGNVVFIFSRRFKFRLQPGDTLRSVSKKFYDAIGFRYGLRRIMALNPGITDADTVLPVNTDVFVALSGGELNSYLMGRYESRLPPDAVIDDWNTREASILDLEHINTEGRQRWIDMVRHLIEAETSLKPDVWKRFYEPLMNALNQWRDAGGQAAWRLAWAKAYWRGIDQFFSDQMQSDLWQTRTSIERILNAIQDKAMNVTAKDLLDSFRGLVTKDTSLGKAIESFRFKVEEKGTMAIIDMKIKLQSPGQGTYQLDTAVDFSNGEIMYLSVSQLSKKSSLEGLSKQLYAAVLYSLNEVYQKARNDNAIHLRFLRIIKVNQEKTSVFFNDAIDSWVKDGLPPIFLKRLKSMVSNTKLFNSMIFDLKLFDWRKIENTAKDKAIIATFQQAPGGIDLNPAQMSMQIKKEGEDFKFNFDGTPIDAVHVSGAMFTILQMTPVTDLPQILGFK